MDVIARALDITKLLKLEYPNAKITLQYDNPLELLVATMLAAQCTDERVNQVTRRLFKKYTRAEDYANADLVELEEHIKPTGFYKNKAKHIKKSCTMIVNCYQSQVPSNMSDLLKLPGVARKTANIVLSHAFGLVVGIAVDTHVRRLAHRMGLTENTNPDKIEKDLMKIIPKEEWSQFTNLLIAHGRAVCKAKQPKCLACIIGKRRCPSFSSRSLS